MSRGDGALPFGAQLQGAATRFRLWAPSQRSVQLALEAGDAIPMSPAGDGWFEAIAPVGAGSCYRFRLDDGSLVPDPASRWQPQDVNGPSCVLDPHSYEWRHTAWRGRPWHESVIAELHVGACGGYGGVAERLGALAAAGITTIELMPLADFPGARNWGYDGVLPFAPDSSCGTPEGLKALVDAAHGHGLSVLLDVVYNHFGPEGNFIPRYAPGFFREDLQTPWGAAIDFRAPAVREFFIQNALHWLQEYRFDGLRLDAVHAIRDATFLDELAQRVRGAIEPGRHVHLVLENEKNEASRLARDGAPRFDAQWNDDAHNALHVLLTGEREGYYAHYADAPAARLARCLAEGFCFQGEVPPGASGPRGEPSASLPPQAFVFFLQNHDQVGNRAQGERLVSLADTGALRAAVLLQLLAPQVPLLFMGEERGCREPFLFFTDFHGPLATAVREGRRREFAKFASYADPARRDSIPDPNDPQTFVRSRPGEGDARWQAYYRALLRLRHERLVPGLPGSRSDGAHALGETGVEARWTLGSGARLRIVANFGQEALPCATETRPLLAESAPGAGQAAADGRVPPRTAAAWLDER